MLVLGVLWLLPAVWALVTSLKRSEDILKVPPSWVPYPATLAQYATIFADDRNSDFARAVFNSVAVATATMVLTLLICAMAAYPLARMRFPGRDLVFSVIIGSLMVPGVISIVPLYLIVDQLGWLSTYQALIVPQLPSAFGVFLLRQFFLSLPVELEEAARIDGATSLQIFARILLPLSQPAQVTLAIFTFQWSWNEFTWPLIAMNNQSMFTLPITLSLLKSAYQSNSYGPIMAGAVVAAVPILFVFVIANRFIIEGVQLSGLKA
jgi:multiple sugar transport system permease protein